MSPVTARNWPRWPHKGTSPGTAAQCRSMTRPAASSSAMHPKFVPPFSFQMIASYRSPASSAAAPSPRMTAASISTTAATAAASRPSRSAGSSASSSAAGALQSWPVWAGCFVRFAIA